MYIPLGLPAGTRILVTEAGTDLIKGGIYTISDRDEGDDEQD